MYQLYCRIYQCVFKWISYLLPWRMPELIEGENSLNKLPKLIKSKGIDSVLIVTDKMIASLGLMDGLLKGLSNEGVDYLVYDRTVQNPTIDNIEEALQMYNANNCKGIVAFGGGSPIDCAKGVGARAARPKKSIPQMKGLFKVLKKIPPLVAIPTTSGTGSETTIAAVITDSRTHEKYAINDTALIPQYAVLDPVLTVNLPQHITSTTGIDALTHAVEAYIGRSNTKATKQYSRDAVKLIFENIFEAYSNGQNLAARKNMQEASFLAGLAFTRVGVGYVHAIAHTLGGFYSVPHGLANAIILPYVLEYYGKSAHKPLAELADMVGLSEPGDNSEQKSFKFIHAIKMLNKSMGIPNKVNGIIESDVPLMVKRALAESNPLYPVPKIMNEEDIMRIYLIIKE
ncbi:iron-containing alcohol dehydrogenase [Desulfosporosinus nitroreducens]|uniref:Iron-containing alcohol dehydrogenase n=1 Tax=Desulfosporosinus nitroreducens TaxID=2018668 RepID=A0ABT8QX37_9FIRM|nr:iron-containing alcohol dehydrogenase [Desulfosporosinus nitroreducens]MDO0825905.1 iron-containing alcohol dehydrogenase [Desulfosporosinus nitroreducens]